MFNFAFISGIEKGCVFAESNNSANLEEELEKETDKLLDNIDFTEIENIVLNIDKEGLFFNGIGFKEYVSLVIKNKEKIDIETIFSLIFKNLKSRFTSLFSPLILVLVVVLICNLFNVIKSGKISGVSEVVYFVCFSIVVIIISSIVKDLITDSKTCVLSLKKQMDSVLPILLTLIMGMGGVVSAKAFSPLVVILSNIVSAIFINILFPLFTLSLVLSIVGNLSESNKLTKLNGFVKSLFKWIIGVVFAVFMGFLTIKGLTAGASDGLSIKATKYAIKNYIPMLGGYINEGFELVKAGSMLVKNATGFVGVILLFFSIITPIISIAIIELGMKLLAGVIEAVGDKKASNLIYMISGSLKLLVVILVGVALMYFITLYILLCSASNFI